MADLVITATQVLRSDDAPMQRGTAGATITSGMAVYYDTDIERWYPSSAASSQAAAVVDGIALNTAGVKQGLTIQTDGPVTLGAGAAPVVGTLYGLSGTAGGIAPLTDVKTWYYRTLVGCGALNNTLIIGVVNSGVLPGAMVNTTLMKAVLPARQVSDTTAQVSSILDILGYEEVMFAFLIGTTVDADATFTVLLEDGNDIALADAAAVADVNMVSQTLAVAPETAASWNFGDDNEVRKLGYIGSKRYLRLTVTPALNTGALDFAVYAILGGGPSTPVIQTPS